MLLSRARLASGAGAIVAAATAAAFLSSGSWSGAQSTNEPGPPPHAGPEDGPLGRYSVFARERRQVDDIAGWRTPRTAPRAQAVQYDKARVVFEDAARTVAVAPSPSGPCLVAQYKDGSGGMSCGGRTKIAASLGYNGALGVVPDSVRSVVFTLTDGRQVREEIRDNLWHSPLEASTATFKLSGRDVTIELMPRSSRPAGTTIDSNGMVTSPQPPA